MKDGTKKCVTREERGRLPAADRRDVPLEIDGKTVLIMIEQVWSNGDVHAVEIDP
jgi:hypothetical protein